MFIKKTPTTGRGFFDLVFFTPASEDMINQGNHIEDVKDAVFVHIPELTN